MLSLSSVIANCKLSLTLSPLDNSHESDSPFIHSLGLGSFSLSYPIRLVHNR